MGYMGMGTWNVLVAGRSSLGGRVWTGRDAEYTKVQGENARRSGWCFVAEIAGYIIFLWSGRDERLLGRRPSTNPCTPLTTHGASQSGVSDFQLPSWAKTGQRLCLDGQYGSTIVNTPLSRDLVIFHPGGFKKPQFIAAYTYMMRLLFVSPSPRACLSLDDLHISHEKPSKCSLQANRLESRLHASEREVHTFGMTTYVRV
ncbi:hypothetical protein BC629DRAFT_1117317 [Irpex lacteus]|nr:hypothetical protein BC629DRAFT_1117317 [Irpex lacteus]